MITKKLTALLRLKKVTNLGDSSIKKMIHHVGSAEEIFNEKPSSLLKIPGIGKTKIKDIHNTQHIKAVENEIKFIEKNNIDCFLYDESSYPEKLKHCIDAPVVLFGSGNIDLKQKKIISIVGTRKITSYGSRLCEELIGALSPLDPVIVSGFAYGVDITAQRAAVQHNLQTIGCLAHGLNQIYPKAHQKYVDKIKQNGGFVTDFWSTDTFDRKNFLSRNRIIAGLSEATIVIESADKGGSLVTAEIANSYNRDVFAIPGRVHDPYSKGCNMLIKTQRAHILTSAADLVYMLNWSVDEKKEHGVQKKMFVELEPDEKKIYNFLNDNGKELLDVIALQCELPSFKTASILLTMELKGVIKPLPGKLFEIA